MVEERKQKEKEFHNVLRGEELKGDKLKYQYLTFNRKFYSIARSSQNFVKELLLKKCKNKKILDYCCGDGDFSIFLAKNGIEVFGIDISEVSIEKAKKKALAEGLGQNPSFFVMDAEATEFPDNYFDIITCLGVLHHLDTKKGFPELARILKPDGYIICDEPLVYNPVFQLYRKMTPHLRTKWEKEHILSKRDIELAKKYFKKIEIRFFHLFSLLAVPLHNTVLFNPFLSLLEKIDSTLLKLPLIKWLSWQIIFILSKPKKS